MVVLKKGAVEFFALTGILSRATTNLKVSIQVFLFLLFFAHRTISLLLLIYRKKFICPVYLRLSQLSGFKPPYSLFIFRQYRVFKTIEER